MEDVMTTDAQEAAKWNAAGANRTAEDIAASRAKAAEMLKTCAHEYDVTVRRGGFASFDVTARSENAKKLLGEGTFTYEQPEWTKLNKDLKHYGYSIEVR
jgi:hypothetical protein